MNLLEMFKSLSDEEKQEFISLIIEEINKSQKKFKNSLIITNDLIKPEISDKNKNLVIITDNSIKSVVEDKNSKSNLIVNSNGTITCSIKKTR